MWHKTTGRTFSRSIDSQLGQYNAKDLQECQDVCQHYSECVAITYSEDRPSDKIDCILRKITKDGLSQDEFKRRVDVDYYEKPTGKSINSINISNFNNFYFCNMIICASIPIPSIYSKVH